MKKVLAIIPARAGSKRLPQKNLKGFSGKPLIAWTIETALQTDWLAKIVVSSDDNAVLEICEKIQKKSLDESRLMALKRPSELAQDQSPAIDYVQHALRHIESLGEEKYDVICILQATSPLTLKEDINGVLELLLASHNSQSEEVDSVVSIMKVEHALHPIKFKKFNKKNKCIEAFWEEERGRVAEHELPELYVRNCAIYASMRAVIDRNLVVGEKCLGYLMPPERSVDINTLLDFKFAEFLKGIGE